MKTPDDVCKAYAGREVQLSISMLDDDMILIEGNELSLEFLGHIILTQARFVKDCGFQMGPKVAGRSFFAEESPFGIYVHRTPCKHPPKNEAKQ